MNEISVLFGESLKKQGIRNLSITDGVLCFEYDCEPVFSEVNDKLMFLKSSKFVFHCAMFEIKDLYRVGYFGAIPVASMLWTEFGGNADQNMWESGATKVSLEMLAEKLDKIYAKIYEEVRENFLILPRSYQRKLKFYDN